MQAHAAKQQLEIKPDHFLLFTNMIMAKTQDYPVYSKDSFTQANTSYSKQFHKNRFIGTHSQGRHKEASVILDITFTKCLVTETKQSCCMNYGGTRNFK